MRRYLILLLFALALTACSQEESRCAKFSGKSISKNQELTAFAHIKTIGSVNLSLRRDSLNVATISGGENLVSHVTFLQIGDTLIIQNENTCSWLRNFDQDLQIALPVTSLESLSIASSGEIVSSENLESQSFTLINQFGGGNIKLGIKCDSLFIYHLGGAADLSISGESNYTYVYQSALSPVFSEFLNSDIVHVRSESGSMVKTHPIHRIIAEIRSSGDICFVSDPAESTLVRKGSGKLLRCE